MAASVTRTLLAIGIPETSLITFVLIWWGATALEGVKTQRRGQPPRRGWLLWAGMWSLILTPLVLLALLFGAWVEACTEAGGCL